MNRRSWTSWTERYVVKQLKCSRFPLSWYELRIYFGRCECSLLWPIFYLEPCCILFFPSLLSSAREKTSKMNYFCNKTCELSELQMEFWIEIIFHLKYSKWTWKTKMLLITDSCDEFKYVFSLFLYASIAFIQFFIKIETFCDNIITDMSTLYSIGFHWIHIDVFFSIPGNSIKLESLNQNCENSFDAYSGNPKYLLFNWAIQSFSADFCNKIISFSLTIISKIGL